MMRKYASVCEIGSEQRRKRKQSSIASRFELVRPVRSNECNPQAPPSVKRRITEISCVPVKKADSSTSIAELASISTPLLVSMSTQMSSKKSQRPEKTSSVIDGIQVEASKEPHLPSHLQGSERFSPEVLSRINPLNFVESCLKAYNVNCAPEHSLSKENYFLQTVQ